MQAVTDASPQYEDDWEPFFLRFGLVEVSMCIVSFVGRPELTAFAISLCSYVQKKKHTDAPHLSQNVWPDLTGMQNPDFWKESIVLFTDPPLDFLLACLLSSSFRHLVCLLLSRDRAWILTQLLCCGCYGRKALCSHQAADWGDGASSFFFFFFARPSCFAFSFRLHAPSCFFYFCVRARRLRLTPP